MYALPLHKYLYLDHFSPASDDHGELRGRVSSPTESELPSHARKGLHTGQVIDLPVPAASSWHRTLADLRRFRKHGPGANTESFKYAEKFLALMSMAAPNLNSYAQLFASGNAVLNFYSDGIQAQFELSSDGNIAANIDMDGQELDLDLVGFSGEEFPEILSDLIGRV